MKPAVETPNGGTAENWITYVEDKHVTFPSTMKKERWNKADPKKKCDSFRDCNWRSNLKIEVFGFKARTRKNESKA